MGNFKVSKEWLEKVDSKVDKPEKIEDRQVVSSLFYDVRPAVLRSNWTESNSIWTASASFITRGTAETFTFPVVAPVSTSNPGGTVNSTRFYVVWRGRWELLAAPASGGEGTSETITYATGRFTLSGQNTLMLETETKEVLVR